MLSICIRLSSRAVVTAVILVSISLPTVLYANKANPTESLDYGHDLYEDKRDKNSEAVLIELLQSSSFKGSASLVM